MESFFLDRVSFLSFYMMRRGFTISNIRCRFHDEMAAKIQQVWRDHYYDMYEVLMYVPGDSAVMPIDVDENAVFEEGDSVLPVDLSSDQGLPNGGEDYFSADSPSSSSSVSSARSKDSGSEYVDSGADFDSDSDY